MERNYAVETVTKLATGVVDIEISIGQGSKTPEQEGDGREPVDLSQ